MNALAEAFAKAAASRKDAEWVTALGKVVSQAVWPFHLGNAIVWIDDGMMDYRIRTIWIELQGLPNYSFKHKFDPDQMMQAYEPHLYLFESMREPLFNHFRYRPCLPVDEHIILGEE
jgi:hypothetical protein